MEGKTLDLNDIRTDARGSFKENDNEFVFQLPNIKEGFTLEKRQRERSEKGLNLLIGKLKESLRKGKHLSFTFMTLQFNLLFKFQDLMI